MLCYITCHVKVYNVLSYVFNKTCYVLFCLCYVIEHVMLYNMLFYVTFYNV